MGNFETAERYGRAVFAATTHRSTEIDWASTTARFDGIITYDGPTGGRCADLLELKHRSCSPYAFDRSGWAITVDKYDALMSTYEADGGLTDVAYINTHLHNGRIHVQRWLLNRLPRLPQPTTRRQKKHTVDSNSPWVDVRFYDLPKPDTGHSGWYSHTTAPAPPDLQR